MADTSQAIGTTIKKVRHQRGLSQGELAAATDLSVSYLSFIEQGRRTPNLEIVEKIAGALGVPLSILVFLASDKSELEEFDKSVAEKLSLIAWKLLESAERAPVPQ